MSKDRKPTCPECEALDRRDFICLLSVAPVALAAGAAAVAQDKPRVELGPMPRLYTPNPAEDLVKELYAGMSEAQKKQVCRRFDDPARRSVNPNRALDETLGW
jgi:hypothetical protein